MKRIRLLMSTAFALPVLLAPVVVSAAPSTTTTTTDTTTTTTTTAETTTKEKAEALTKRLEANKKLYVVKLNPSDEARLKARCKNAQIKGKTLAANVAKNNIARVAAYSKITTKIDKLITKLQDEDIDSKKLETQATELKTLITTYNANLKLYQTAISDLNSTDCVTDPTAFKVNLEAARAARTVVATDAAAIRTFVSGSLKETLKETKLLLAKDTTKTTEGVQ